jgi:hypothetical protein
MDYRVTEREVEEIVHQHRPKAIWSSSMKTDLRELENFKIGPGSGVALVDCSKWKRDHKAGIVVIPIPV